jgi:hypothetical protein
MSLSLEEKVDFIFKIVLKMAEKEKLLTLSQLWMAEGGLSQETVGKAAQALAPVVQKIRDGEPGKFQDVETALLEAGFTKAGIKWVIGVLYADYQDAVGDILSKLGDLPQEIKMMLRKARNS